MGIGIGGLYPPRKRFSFVLGDSEDMFFAKLIATADEPRVRLFISVKNLIIETFNIKANLSGTVGLSLLRIKLPQRRNDSGSIPYMYVTRTISGRVIRNGASRGYRRRNSRFTAR